MIEKELKMAFKYAYFRGRIKMKSVLDNEKKKIVFFWNSKKNLYLFIVIITLVTYASKIVLYNYSIDTEQFIKNPMNTLNWWLQIGRYGLVFLKRFLSFGMNMNIIFTNIVTYLLLANSAFLLCYLIWRKNRYVEKNYIYYISSALYVSSPIILEQTNFVLQSVEVLISLIFLIISIIFIQIGVTNKKIAFYILSMLLATFSFSIYPSNQVAFVGLAAISIYLSLEDKSIAIFEYFFKVLPYILILGISYIINLVISDFVIRLSKLESSSYLTDGSLFGVIPKKEILNSIISDYKIYFININNFFVFILTILGFFLILAILIKKNCLSYKICAFISILVSYVATTFSLFYLGWIGPIRSLFPTVPIILFFFSFLFLELINNKFSIVIATIFLSVCSLGQIKTTSDMGVAEYNVYQQEINLINEISYTLKSRQDFTNFSDYKLAIIGYKSFNDGYLPKTDVIGRSVFEWNYVRMRDFIYNQNLDFKDISTEEYNKAVEQSKDMKSFPKEGSIKIVEDVLIIRL